MRKLFKKTIALSKSGKDEGMREYVAENHGLKNLIKRLISEVKVN